MSKLSVVQPESTNHNQPFDVADFTREARTKLAALSFLMHEVSIETCPESDVFHGLAWMLDDIRATLEEKGGA